MFLSTYQNKLDKKGRVSVPASFRSHLSNLGYNGVICYPSFNNSSIEACSQDRIEKISSVIDSLNPFEEKRDYFATSILAESINLQFDSEGRISIPSKLLKHSKIKNSILFVLLKLPFKISSINIRFFSCIYLKFFKGCWFPYLKSLTLTNKQHAIFNFGVF